MINGSISFGAFPSIAIELVFNCKTFTPSQASASDMTEEGIVSVAGIFRLTAADSILHQSIIVFCQLYNGCGTGYEVC